MSAGSKLDAGKVRHLEYIAVLTIVAFTVALAALSIFAGIDQVIGRLTGLPWTLIATMLGLSLINYALRAARWHVFSRGLGINLPVGRNIVYFIAGFALTTTPGKAGEALRLWLLERCHGQPYEKAAPLFLGDRLSDMVAILALCAAGVGAFAGYWQLTLAAAVGVVVLVWMFWHPLALLRLIDWIWRRVGKRKPRLFAKIRAAVRGTKRLLAPRLFGPGLVLALIGWLAEAYAFHLLLVELGGGAGFQAAMFIFTFAMIAGTVAMLPGGLGGTEATMMALLAAIAVPFDAALTATALIRLTTLWFACGLGFIALPVAMRWARRRVPPPDRDPRGAGEPTRKAQA